MVESKNIPNWWSYHTADGTNVFTTSEATTKAYPPKQEVIDNSHRELYKGVELSELSDAEFEQYCIWLASEVARCETEERKRATD